MNTSSAKRFIYIRFAASLSLEGNISDYVIGSAADIARELSFETYCIRDLQPGQWEHDAIPAGEQ